ncbi:MAG: sugar kinase [Actinobacteria bacterium]|nr:sugar kinase [Actinomycetota bacterium]
MALLANPVVGPLRHATTLDVSVGGAESNAAIGLRRLGATAAWTGRVGDDELGRLVLARLRGEGLDVAAATVDPDAPTGLMIKERRTAWSTRVSYYRTASAASRLRPAHLDEALLGGARLVHVTGITPALSASAREATFAGVDVARDAGVPVSVDLNYRAALWPADEAGPVLRDLVARADLVFAGEDEAEMVLDAGDRGHPGRLAAGLARMGPRQAVVKRGPRGAVADVDGRTLHADALEVTAVDPVGAGDAFVAGYLRGALDGEDARGCLRLATLVGAFAVTVRGDWEGLPERQELALLAADADPVVR